MLADPLPQYDSVNAAQSGVAGVTQFADSLTLSLTPSLSTSSDDPPLMLADPLPQYDSVNAAQSGVAGAI